MPQTLSSICENLDVLILETAQEYCLSAQSGVIGDEGETLSEEVVERKVCEERYTKLGLLLNLVRARAVLHGAGRQSGEEDRIAQSGETTSGEATVLPILIEVSCKVAPSQTAQPENQPETRGQARRCGRCDVPQRDWNSIYREKDCSSEAERYHISITEVAERSEAGETEIVDVSVEKEISSHGRAGKRNIKRRTKRRPE
ncbi:hypothetical protein TRICHSKD4_4475 [Roseibium sp. TrichSKD4]|uniref:hypothetical protein n=1 Tax=Roseibium sp. TrichSKD4 TaxID=744980 RepID=UPI0001E57532|nr:hypothetical protein [Roseibium sp. TrichSKD4]EFO30876.1 hypothetical protein TRICHSKD4_4475 [Roseibium sp. TrichSKD4]